jgi:retron-type reverse transcriptase
MFRFQELYEAYLRCRKTKRNKKHSLKFEINYIENIWNLEKSLNQRVYLPKSNICFLVKQPKLREVFAGDFSDRVIHHLIVNILEDIFEPLFIHDSYSNRKNRGIHQAVSRAKKFAINSEYYLQLDIKNFFYTIDKDTLYKKLESRLKRDFYKVQYLTAITLDEMLWILKVIIYHDITKDVIIKGDKKLIAKLPKHKSMFTIPKSKGLPIGNLTSQFFANVYMNDFDNYIKRVLKQKYYLRYVDDFVIFGKDKKELINIKQKVEDYLYQNLGLSLRDDTKLKSVNDGLDFLGYIIRPAYILTRQRVINNFRKKKSIFYQKYEDTKYIKPLSKDILENYKQVKASFYGHIKHSNSHRLKQKLLNKERKNYEKIIFSTTNSNQ